MADAPLRARIRVDIDTEDDLPDSTVYNLEPTYVEHDSLEGVAAALRQALTALEQTE